MKEIGRIGQQIEALPRKFPARQEIVAVRIARYGVNIRNVRRYQDRYWWQDFAIDILSVSRLSL